MKTAEETACFIRHRQHELAALEPQERQAKLGAEIRQLWRGVSPSARQELIDRLEPLFPIGLGQQDIVAVPVVAPPPKLELDDLIALLAKEVEARPESEQPAIRARVAKTLGCEPTIVEPSITVEAFIAALEKLKWRALGDPDPVLNPGIKSFSRSDIVNLPAFVAKVRPPNGGVSKFLRDRLPLETRNLLLGIRGSESELNRLCDRLEQELPPHIVEGEPIDEALRSSGVKLSEESQLLLEKSPRSDRQRIRLNQSLLEDAYPDELKFQTTERELIESIVAGLQPMAAQSLAVETVLDLAAVALMELGCLEQFGRKILHELNQRVFDEVHGRVIEEKNSLDVLVARLIERADADGFGADVRRRTGIVECLLYWYGYASGEAARRLAGFDPSGFEKTTSTFMKGATVDYQASWNEFSKAYRGFLEELSATNEQGIGEGIGEDQLKQTINKSIERRVTTQLADAYAWKIREEQT